MNYILYRRAVQPLLLCFLAAITGLVQGSRAQVEQKVITTQATYSESLDTADLNGNNRLDVVSLSGDKDWIKWYRNEVGETGADADGFGSGQVITTEASGPTSVETADVDSDGDVDVLSTSYRDDKVAWYANDGSGGFGPQQVISTAADGAWTVHSTDLDGDGDPDVISGSRRDGKIAWYENQTGEDGADADGFGSQQIITVDADAAESVYAADLDGDGDKDVLSASAHDDKIAWYENQIGESGSDSDGFGPQQIISSEMLTANHVYADDLDGDGDVDVVSSAKDSREVAWFENDGSGNFGSKKVISNLGWLVYAVHVEDVNGDGKPDVLSAWSDVTICDGDSDDRGKIAWNENQIGESGTDGDGFGPLQDISTEVGVPNFVFASDIDGDGDGDVLSVSCDDTKIAWYENSTGVLPVELVTLDATVDDEVVQLTWRTASETANAGFEIQRQREGGNAWKQVGYREGSGTTDESQTYRFVDGNIPYAADSLRYRLRQVDTDGTASLTDPILVERGRLGGVQIRGTTPNPARHRISVRYGIPELTKSAVRFQLYDMLGRQVRSVEVQAEPGRHRESLDVSGLPSGTYVLRLQAGGQMETRKLTVVK